MVAVAVKDAIAAAAGASESGGNIHNNTTYGHTATQQYPLGKLKSAVSARPSTRNRTLMHGRFHTYSSKAKRRNPYEAISFEVFDQAVTVRSFGFKSDQGFKDQVFAVAGVVATSFVRFGSNRELCFNKQSIVLSHCMFLFQNLICPTWIM